MGDKSNLDITKNERTYTFAELEKKNKNFFAPACKILANGEDIFGMGVQVTTLTVDHSVQKASDCSLAIVPVPGERPKKPIERIFPPETVVEVYMGYSDALEAVFAGAASNIGFSFSSAGSPSITVTCGDFSQALMKGSVSCLWEKDQYNSFSEVVTKILSKYLDGSRLTKKVVEDAETAQKPPFAQRGQSDYAFIKGVADQNNIDFFISGNNVYFQKRQTPKPIVKLVWGESLGSFSGSIQSARLVSEAVAKGSDIKGKPFTVQADIGAVKSQISGDRLFDFVKGAYENKTQMTVATEFKEPESAEKQAKDALIGRNKDFFTASGDCVGIPQIMAGRVLTIEGVGELLSGDYYVTGAKHTLNSSGYRTSFTLSEVHG